MSNIQARAPTEAVIPKYVQPKTILSLDVPSDLNILNNFSFDNKAEKLFFGATMDMRTYRAAWQRKM